MPDGEYAGVVLNGDSLIAMNRLNDTEVKESACTVTVKGGVVYADVKKLSFYEFVISAKI